MKKILLIIVIIAIVSGQWINLSPNGPPNIVTGPSAKIPPPSLPQQNNGAMWCFEDCQYVLNNGQMWKYEIKDNRWLWQPDPPKEIQTVTAYFNVEGTTPYLFVNGLEMWTYDTLMRKFTQLPQRAPFVCLSPVKNTFWNHDTANMLYIMCNETTLLSFDISSATWNVHSVAVVNGAGAGLGPIVAIEDIVYMYSGDAVWEMDTSSFNWTKAISVTMAEPPGPNRTGSAFWQNKEGELMLFGGISGSHLYGDTWLYSPNSKSWIFKDNLGPLARSDPLYCVHTFLYMFGAPSLNQNDMWQYGPFTVKNVLDIIESKLGSATLMSTGAMIASILTFVLFLGFAIAHCTRQCINKRRNNINKNDYMSTPLVNSKSNDVIVY